MLDLRTVKILEMQPCWHTGTKYGSDLWHMKCSAAAEGYDHGSMLLLCMINAFNYGRITGKREERRKKQSPEDHKINPETAKCTKQSTR